MERLAPVDMLPQTRLRLRFSCGGANSAFTLLQSHSSSSATSIGSAVKLPWPISDLATRMVTVSSGCDHDPGSDLRRGPDGVPRSRPERDVEAERQRAADGADACRKKRRRDRGPRRSWDASRSRAAPAAWIAARMRADRCRSGRYW